MGCDGKAVGAEGPWCSIPHRTQGVCCQKWFVFWAHQKLLTHSIISFHQGKAFGLDMFSIISSGVRPKNKPYDIGGPNFMYATEEEKRPHVENQVDGAECLRFLPIGTRHVGRGHSQQQW